MGYIELPGVASPHTPFEFHPPSSIFAYVGYLCIIASKHLKIKCLSEIRNYIISYCVLRGKMKKRFINKLGWNSNKLIPRGVNLFIFMRMDDLFLFWIENLYLHFL